MFVSSWKFFYRGPGDTYVLRRQGDLVCVIAITITRERRAQWLCPRGGEGRVLKAAGR